MKNIGMYLMLFGIGSIVLNLIGYNFSILMWIDNWGDTVGWVIRGGAAFAGAGLWFLTPAPVEEVQQQEDAQEA